MFKDAKCFEIFDFGKLGHHLNCNRATTLVLQQGCLKDNVNYRACWKSDKQQQDTYKESLPWPDGSVDAALYPVGPVKYTVNPKSKATDTFLLQKVVHYIALEIKQGGDCVRKKRCYGAIY